MKNRVAVIGLGEVGGAIAADLLARGVAVEAYDRLFADETSRPSQTAGALGLSRPASAADAARGAELVISAVTAAQTEAVAEAAASGMEADAFYLDLNSASPGAKLAAAERLAARGARYVEGAVMSPFPPKRLGTTILLGGPHAETIAGLLRELGFGGVRVFSPVFGKASAAKMCRSVVVKGMEALVSESLLAARRFDVDNEVLASLDDLFPGPKWATLSRYLIARTLEHGARRAEEMREVARTVAEAGVTPHMAAAAAERQAWAPAYAAALNEAELGPMLDAMRALMTSGAVEPKDAD